MLCTKNQPGKLKIANALVLMEYWNFCPLFMFLQLAFGGQIRSKNAET
jgi:hypothetical protein